MLCISEICPCRWHSMKIKNDFFDIFEVNFTPEEERELVEKITGEFSRDWREWEEGGS